MDSPESHMSAAGNVSERRYEAIKPASIGFSKSCICGLKLRMTDKPTKPRVKRISWMTTKGTIRVKDLQYPRRFCQNRTADSVTNNNAVPQKPRVVLKGMPVWATNQIKSDTESQDIILPNAQP